MSTPALDIQDLTFAYDQHQALDGLTFDVPVNCRYGILGPNGSGKSTLFKLLTTLMPMQSGTALLNGIDVRSNPAAVRQILGVTFQSPSLDNKLTVYENLWCQGMIYGLESQVLKANINEALEELQLSDRRNQLVEKLSGGLKRRVEIAKSLLHRPRILLMDEPSTGLDPLARHELWQYLTRLVERHQMTLILTTHLMDEAEKCDQLLLMHQGKTVITGTPLQLKQSLSGDILTIRSAEIDRLLSALQSDYSEKITQDNESIRIVTESGSHLLAEITQKYKPLIREISLHQPTLEDLFLARTGKEFYRDA